MQLVDALVYVRQQRPIASPNAGFMEVLLGLEQDLFGGSISIDMDLYRNDRFTSTEELLPQTVRVVS